jgi:hypothetical protein
MATCGGCGEEIHDVVLEAFGMTWHTYHLCCNKCGKDFSDGSKVEEGEDNFAYCSECFVTAFSTICAGCNQVVEGEVINALEASWHPDCFVCTTCKQRVPDSFFPGPNGPLCEKHYYQSQGMLLQRVRVQSDFFFSSYRAGGCLRYRCAFATKKLFRLLRAAKVCCVANARNLSSLANV